MNYEQPKLPRTDSMVSGYVTGQALESKLRLYLLRSEYIAGGGSDMSAYYTKQQTLEAIDNKIQAKVGDEISEADLIAMWG